MEASTTLEQLVHHGHSSNAFRGWLVRDCKTGDPLPFSDGFCCEKLLGAWLYRAGLRRRRSNLGLTLMKYLPKLVASSSVSELKTLTSARLLSREFEPELRFAAHSLLDAENQANEAYCNRVPELAHVASTHVMVPYHATRKMLESLLRTRGDKRPWPECNKTSALSKTDFGIAQPACEKQRVPPCLSTVDLLQPLPACVRRLLYDVVTNVSGYGSPFPWWQSCGKLSCTNMPNVSFKFDGDGLEPAILLPHMGHAQKASNELVGSSSGVQLRVLHGADEDAVHRDHQAVKLRARIKELEEQVQTLKQQLAVQGRAHGANG